MILIIGGAYQGKLEYALKRFNKTQADVFKCEDDIELSKPIICGLHRYTLAKVKSGGDPAADISTLLPHLRDKIIISDDISCGIVPVEPELRLWRECNGHVLALLARHSDEVIRVFCGLPLKLI